MCHCRRCLTADCRRVKKIIMEKKKEKEIKPHDFIPVL